MGDRAEREREFHNEAAVRNPRRVLTGCYAGTRRAVACYESLLYARCHDQDVLEYGCGSGSEAFALARRGARVVGIDISDAAIAQARKEAEQESLRAEFCVMNAEQLGFGCDRFDAVCGSGILHHLDLAKALEEVARVLRGDGYAVFLEPLSYNPLMRVFRKLTPRLRTPDEHPLLMEDITLAGKYFGRVEAQYFCLTSLAALPFYRTRWFAQLHDVLSRADEWLFRLMPYMRRFAWITLLVMRLPVRQEESSDQ